MDNNDKRKTDVSFKNGIHVHDSDKDVDISFRHGVHVHGKNEDVDVSRKGIHVETENDSVHLDEGAMREYAKLEARRHKGRIILDVVIVVAAVGIYLLFGKTYGVYGWSYGWLVFLLMPIVDSAISAFRKKKPSEFAYAVLATFIFLMIGFFTHIWHPSWVIFLTIPVYYVICDLIEKRKNK